MEFFKNFDWYEIPLDRWIENAVGINSWIVREGGPFFDAIRYPVAAVLDGIEDFLLWLPWPLVIAVMAVIGWRISGWRVAVFVGVAFMFIGLTGYWQLAMTTFSMMTTAVLFSAIMGVPVGIWMSRSNRVVAIVRPLLDFMQTIPTFVYLVPVVMFFGIGKLPGVIATVVYAVPPITRLTNLGIRQVPTEVVEAARSFGASGFQLLFEIQLPLAWPTIMAGLNQTIMMALAMVVIAALIGAQGLGMEVWIGLSQLRVGKAAAAGLAIVCMAMILDRMTQSLGSER